MRKSRNPLLQIIVVTLSHAGSKTKIYRSCNEGDLALHYRVEKTPRQWYMRTSHDQISASLVVSARGNDKVCDSAASRRFSLSSSMSA